MKESLAKVRMLALDADGVLSDGGLFFIGGEIGMRFDIKDGQGLRTLIDRGIICAVISGRRRSRALSRRCRQLGIDRCFCGVKDKVACAESLLAKAGLEFAQLAYMGDDLPDLKLLERAGFAAAPADAVPAVLDVCDWVSGAKGGHGAVRELCELIIEALPDSL